MNEKLSELKTRLAEIHDLDKIHWVLNWDQRTHHSALRTGVQSCETSSVFKTLDVFNLRCQFPPNNATNRFISVNTISTSFNRSPVREDAETLSSSS